MIKFKVVKPTLLRRDRMNAELERMAPRMAKTLIEDFKRTTRTWKRQPKFYYAQKVKKRFGIMAHLELVVGTDDVIFGYVDKGTRGPYQIKPKGPWPLRFSVGGQPKTKPGKLISTAGQPGTLPVQAQSVTHPGIEARKFSELILKKRINWMEDEFRAVFGRIARVSGHSV